MESIENVCASALSSQSIRFIGNTWFSRSDSQFVFSKHPCPWTTEYATGVNDWPVLLAAQGVSPIFLFNNEIANLPQTVTAQELASMSSSAGLEPTPERFLLRTKISVGMREQSRSLRRQMKPEDWQNEDLTTFAGISPTRVTDRERMILRWNSGYGTVEKYRSNVSFAINREYLFTVPAVPEIYLSLLEERNTQRMLFGFRQGGNTGFPIDHKVKFGISFSPEYSKQLLETSMKMMECLESYLK